METSSPKARKEMVFEPDLRYISYSQLGSFNSCAYKHQLQYGRLIKPILSSDAMNLGSALHQAIEAHLLGESPEAAIKKWATSKAEDWEIYEGLSYEDENGDQVISLSIAGMLGAQVAGVVSRALELLPYVISELGDKWEVVHDAEGFPLIEYPLVVVLDGDLRFHGYVDAVLREKATGLTWVVDFKTREYIQPEPEDDFETQTQLYAYALATLGVVVQGSLIYQISTKVPKKPNVNKTGGISKQDIHTTWEIYKQVVLDNGYDPDDYLGMRDKLERKKFFMQIRTYRSDETLDRAWAEFIEGVSFMLEAQEIFKLRIHRGEGTAPRNFNNFSCPRCVYRVFCSVEYESGDASHLMGHMFVKGDH